MYRMSLSMHVVYFLKSYKVSKIAMVYDKYIPYICMVYTRIIMFFNELRFYCKLIHETATTSLNQHVLMHS